MALPAIWHEAFLLKLAKRGVEGDSAAARESLAVIEEARKQQSPVGPLNIVCESAPWNDPAQINGVSGLTCRSASGPHADSHKDRNRAAS
jgi:hypothetical protein